MESVGKAFAKVLWLLMVLISLFLGARRALIMPL